MKSPTIQNKAEQVFILVKNDHTSAITRGQPCCFVADGTEDGLAVVPAATGGAAKATSLFAGIVVDDSLAQNEKGLAQVFGYNGYTVVTRQTRSASDTDYATAPAIAIGDILNVDTVANGMTRSAAGAASAALPYCVAMESTASKASSASATGDTSVAKTIALKTFLRAL